MIPGLPKTLRVIGIVLVILGALFKIQHWPWTEVIFITAWAFTLIAMVWRPMSGQPMLSKEAMRDLFTFGMVSVIVMRMLHLPGKGYALAVAALGGVGLLWLDRDRIIPSGSGNGPRPLLFYTALLLVISGTLFRIQHWPHSTPLLISGLVLVGIWFLSTGEDDGKEG